MNFILQLMSVQTFACHLVNGHYSEDIYFNTPSHYLPNLTRPDHLYFLKKTEIIFVIGEDDPFKSNNQHLSKKNAL